MQHPKAYSPLEKVNYSMGKEGGLLHHIANSMGGSLTTGDGTTDHWGWDHWVEAWTYTSETGRSAEPHPGQDKDDEQEKERTDRQDREI